MTKHLGRADTQALLGGQPVAGEQLAEVEDFFAAMRADYGALPAPAPRPTLASILDGRRPLRTVPAPIEPATDRPSAWSRWTRPRRPVAVALATGFVIFSGLAAADALPAPIQRAIADLGSGVGLDLPRPSDSSPTPPRTGSDAPDAATGANGATGGGTADVPGGLSSDSPPGSVGTLPDPSGAAPGVPNLPSMPLPEPTVPDTLTPPVSRIGAGLGLGDEGLLPDLPEAPFGPPNP